MLQLSTSEPLSPGNTLSSSGAPGGSGVVYVYVEPGSVIVVVPVELVITVVAPGVVIVVVPAVFAGVRVTCPARATPAAISSAPTTTAKQRPTPRTITR